MRPAPIFMKLSLNNPVSKLLLAGPLFFLVASFAVFSGAQYLAAINAENTDLISLHRAVLLQPNNAEYRYRLGLSYSLLQPDMAVPSFRAAVALDPYRASYWLALAQADEALSDTDSQASALKTASLMAPTDSTILWQVANAYFSRGDTQQAINQCSRLLNDDGPGFGRAFEFCWRVKPNIDLFLQNLLPAKGSDYESALNFFISKGDLPEAGKIWQGLVNLRNPITRRQTFEYVRFLLEKHQPYIASEAWKQSAPFASLEQYQPSAANLIVNGDFSLPVLNGGFDWLYHANNNVSLTIDQQGAYSADRSLLLSFNGAQIEDAGIGQMVTVNPDRTYNFSAFYKAREMQGAGGMRFVVQDAYSGNIFFASDYLATSDDWKQVQGSFTASPDTQLLLVRLQRVPANNVIEGSIWIDGVNLQEQANTNP